MSGFGSVGHGFSLKALLEDPNLQNPPNLNSGLVSLKKTSKHGGFMPNANSAFLGPNLWEKPSSGSEDFDLEYMDLDEFLSENGVPVDPNEIDDAQTISLLANALSSSPSRSPNERDSPIMIGPLSPKLEDHLDMMMKETSMASPSNYYMPITPPSVHQNSISSPTPSEPSAIERCLMESTFELKVDSSEPPKPPMAPTSVKSKIAEVDFQMKSQEIAMVTIPVYRQNSPQIMSSSISPSPSPVWDSSQHSDDCTSTLTHNTVPGQDNFDPKSRKFSEEELKPQPIIKKSKKIFVDDQNKDEKYWNRRSKNNVAAKRSRDARRVKENQIAMRAAFLEQEYENMKQELQKTLLENKDLIRRLSKYENV